MVLPSLLEPLVRIPYLISVASLCVQDVASRSVNPHVHPIIQFSLKESNVSGAVKLNFQDSRVGVGRTDNGARLVSRDPSVGRGRFVGFVGRVRFLHLGSGRRRRPAGNPAQNCADQKPAREQPDQ